MNYFTQDDVFFEHFGSTEGIRTNNNFTCKLSHITESELKEAIINEKCVCIDAVKIYIHSGINYSTRYSARVTLINKPSAYLLASNYHNILFYKDMDKMRNALRTYGYCSQKRDLNIIPCILKV